MGAVTCSLLTALRARRWLLHVGAVGVDVESWELARRVRLELAGRVARALSRLARRGVEPREGTVRQVEPL